ISSRDVGAGIMDCPPFSSLDPQPPDYGLPVRIDGDFGGEASRANGVLIAAALTLLHEKRFDAAFNPSPLHRPLEELTAARPEGTAIHRVPVLAVGLRFQRYVNPLPGRGSG